MRALHSRRRSPRAGLTSTRLSFSLRDATADDHRPLTSSAQIFVMFYVTSDEDRPPLDGGQRWFWRRLRYAPGPPKSSDDVWRGPPRGAIGGRHRPGPNSTSPTRSSPHYASPLPQHH
ncbi:hypothetical protein VTO73DRAFT_4363 [Trametes versicolor]